MRIRRKLDSGEYEYGGATNFNTHGVGEVVCYFKNTGCDLEYIDNLEVQLSNGEWKPMSKAFEDKDIIINNINTEFDEPHSDTEREQGFYY